MENNGNQQPNSNVVSPTGQTTTPAAPAPVPQQTAPQAAPIKKPTNYIAVGFGVLILLVIFLPNSTLAQMLAYPIIILGAIAGIKFFIDSIRSSRAKNPLIRSFVVFGGFGVGAVIFIVCLIAGAIVGFAKDPNPQSTG